MAGPSPPGLALASTFATAASRYWLGVFPRIGGESKIWRERAQRIPDARLRELALLTQREERGNLEGAAAFAVLAPRERRAEVLRALLAFQAAYDYLDTLAEQPAGDPVANGRQLHLALLAALEPGGGHADYYALDGNGDDGGYLRALVECCRDACATLPSFPAVAEPARRAAARMVTYQALTHGNSNDFQGKLAGWATELTPAGTGLRWWEAAAASASSLSVLALIAAAAEPGLTSGETAAIEHAYFPWIGALHVLLDSLADRDADVASGHHRLIDHYDSREQARRRLGEIAARASASSETAPHGREHHVILAAMASFYLSAPSIASPDQTPIARAVLGGIGPLGQPAMAVLRSRRAIARATLGPAEEAAVPAPRRQSSRLPLLESQVFNFPLAGTRWRRDDAVSS
jgi:tetraprenyl-beta-curcumene synthase